MAAHLFLRCDHIAGFVNIPLGELQRLLGEILSGKPVYGICQSGLHSYIATRILEGHGFEAYSFANGFRFYTNDQVLIGQATACGMDQ